MLIRDLEWKTGLDRATIRFYEREGLIAPERKDNGYREYTEEHLSHLLKIKLLRQLGMSLDMIKNLQQGTVDFNAALSERIQTLEKQMKDAQKSKEVCTALRASNVCYKNLDAQYYLNMLTKSERSEPSKVFYENVERPYHPARRFFARWTDYVILELILLVLLIVVFRIRPYGKFLSIVVAYGTPFVSLIVSAVTLRYCGTTPGKWLYGLSVYSENGNLLSFDVAFNREFEVLKSGYGFGLPVYSIVRMIISLVRYRREEPEWDRYSEYRYHKWSRLRKVLLVMVIVTLSAVTLFVAHDIIKPKHRGEITIEQFSENFNYYYNQLSDRNDSLLADGTWTTEPGNQVTIFVGGEPADANKNFEYYTENSIIQKICYENTWSDVQFIEPIPVKFQFAAITALMSQKGTGAVDLMKFTSALSNADYSDDGLLEYENIEVFWRIDAQNCAYDGNYYYRINQKAEASVHIVMEIIVHVE